VRILGGSYDFLKEAMVDMRLLVKRDGLRQTDCGRTSGDGHRRKDIGSSALQIEGYERMMISIGGQAVGDLVQQFVDSSLLAAVRNLT